MSTESEKGNKIIAEFMGYKWQPGSSINGVKGILCKKGMGSFHLDINQPFHAKYHS